VRRFRRPRAGGEGGYTAVLGDRHESIDISRETETRLTDEARRLGVSVEARGDRNNAMSPQRPSQNYTLALKGDG